jgi:ferritin-like protein
MAAGSGQYHEPIELLSEETKNMQRALVSVMEELEAIDWYQQRAEACSDPDLKKILLHNKEEEMEHAMMGLEWIRRHSPSFDKQARAYLFSTGDLTNLEEKEMGEGSTGGGSSGSSSTASQSLGIGSLRGRF